MGGRTFAAWSGFDLEVSPPAGGARWAWLRTVLVVGKEPSTLDDVRMVLEEVDLIVTVESDLERALARVEADADAFAALVAIVDPLVPASVRLAGRVRTIAPRIGIAAWSPTNAPPVAGVDRIVSGVGSLQSLANVVTLLVDGP